MPALSDLIETKTLLDIPLGNTSEDTKLLLLLTTASDWIAELLNRPGLFLKSRTEYYNGENTTDLLLKSRPVYTEPTIQCWVDSNGYWGQTSGTYTSNSQLVYGTDFVLKIDQDDGISRSGILYRRNGVWNKKHGREQGWLTPFVVPDTGSIKVTYTGGYTVDGLPAQLRFACNTLVAKMRTLMPMGMEIQSESYEERNVALIGDRKDYLLATVKDAVLSFRNWRW